MAQKVEVLLIDDVDGTEADETLTFGLDGKVYEIDLSMVNAVKLRDLLEPYRKAGRRLKADGSSAPTRKASASGKGGPKTADVRKWARENGFRVLDRGRIPANIMEAYLKANA
ncbi:Lsr2 family protein [Streptomyces sp. NPDC047967]|uniref:histone-like nucleoid-structuring protein Lsr2 n=1 Tax=Streptomyces sp. NPDC047967 TaxID=3154924 RepID=UPI0033DCDDB3